MKQEPKTRVFIQPGQVLAVCFMDEHGHPMDGEFRIDFDTVDEPNRIVVRENAGLPGSVRGSGNEVFYIEEFNQPPDKDQSPPADRVF